MTQDWLRIGAQIWASKKSASLGQTAPTVSPLSSMCLCDDVRDTVVNLLETQIKPALAAIHQRSFIFFDLHAGNVVCDNPADPKNLCLIDLESLTKIGDSLDTSPLKAKFKGEKRPAEANKDWDGKRFKALVAWVKRGGTKR